MVKKPNIKASKKTTKKAGKAARSGLAKGSATVSRNYSKVSQKRRAKKDARARRKAEYLATLPKSRVKRIIYRLHPKRLYRYWFSKDGVMMALKITGVGFALMLLFTMSVFAYFRRGLPDPSEINSRILSQSTKFYDRTGQHLLYEVYGDENRTVIEFDQISQHAKDAVVAIEDKDFYEHGGVSFRGIARAAWSNFTTGETTGQGGSTITQQFIKNSLLTAEQTYTRKIQEIILSLELERLYSKDEILAFYMNEIPFGPQEYGIQAAAQSFFNKDASQLGIAEAAMLAALPQAPTYYSPYGDNIPELITRQQTIINLMHEQGRITDEQRTTAINVDIIARVTPLDQRSLYTNIFAPHFVLEVQNQLEQEFGASVVQTGGFKVITTLDMDLQKIAEQAVKDADSEFGFCDRNGACGDNAAIVASDIETGQVTALVGSRNFTYPGYGSFNAALADRQPGSSFKPFDYSQLFYNERWGADSYIYDVRTTWGDYRPDNFDFGFRGRMRVREALGESRNIPAVKATDIAGASSVVNLAIDMGNVSLSDDPGYPDQYDLSYSLGAGEIKLAEHTHAYGTFARGGKYVPQAYILSVENADGEKLLEWEQDEGEQVLDEQIAWLMTDILADDAARTGTFGANNSNLVVPGLNHAVKTGSTDESVDGLMMGYTAKMSVGVWVGNHDNTPMDSFTSHQTGPIFTQFMGEAHTKKEFDFTTEILPRPEGIQNVRINSATGYAADGDDENTFVGLFPSWYQPETSDAQTKYTIDRVSGKLATECTPERAKETRTGGGLWPEVLPDDYRFASWAGAAGYSGGGGGPTEKDDVHKCSDELPSVSISVVDQGGGDFRFTATVARGTFPLRTLNFKVDGQIVNSMSIGNTGGTFSYNHTFNSNGSFDVSAEVIDQGLYDNTNTTTADVSGAGGGGFSIISPSDGATGVDPSITFSWSSYSGADAYNFCYKLAAGGSFTCLDNGTSTSYSPGLLSNSSYEIFIEAEESGSVVEDTSTITITTGP